MQAGNRETGRTGSAETEACIGRALAAMRSNYAGRHPLSAAASRAAAAVLPGGNTRSVLHFEPFPLHMQSGQGAMLRDVDGNAYLDCVGEYSAGLYGHSDPIILDALRRALDRGLVLGAPTELERALAQVICTRFPSIELLRFCNSGTEANLFALATALAVTGRKAVLAFHEAYHGGVLAFAGGGGRLNVPHDFIVADYNDAHGAAALARRHASALAAIIVEPILGAGGNIPADPEFLATLRQIADETGAMLIFDEVKTSRCGSGGMQGLHGIRPDLTTLGKYIGGGLPAGAFGGRAGLMERFDPSRPGAFRHAGTFNNNVLSMSAGLVGLTRVFTAERATTFLEESEAFRQELAALLRARAVPMQPTGLGSMFSLHTASKTISRTADIPPISRTVGQLFHLFALTQGVLVCSRGDVFLSLAMTDTDRETLRQVVLAFVDRYGDIVREAV